MFPIQPGAFTSLASSSSCVQSDVGATSQPAKRGAYSNVSGVSFRVKNRSVKMQMPAGKRSLCRVAPASDDPNAWHSRCDDPNPYANNQPQQSHSIERTMPNLDMLLLKGPSPGVEEGLNELRFAILTEGIPANSEGMVCPRFHLVPLWFNMHRAGPLPSQLLAVPPIQYVLTVNHSPNCACTYGLYCSTLRR